MSLKESSNFKVILAFVFAVALILRLWRLNVVPVSVFGDEIDVGIQASSIITTGKDYLSNFLPILIHSFSEYRLPMQLYVDAPFVGILGLNEWGVRMPNVLFGMITLVSFYYLIRELFGKKLALISSVFLTVSPWHLMYSRQANDSGMLSPFLILGTLFFIKGMKDYRRLILSAVLFSVGIYSYATATLLIPLYVLVLILIYRRKVFRYPFNKLLKVGMVTIIILIPYIRASLDGRTTSRFSYISGISNKIVMEEVESNRLWSNSAFARLIYNRNTVYTEGIVRRYIQSFSPFFLFVTGDPNLRQSIGSFGELYYFDLVLMMIGITIIIKKFDEKSKEEKLPYYLLGAWLLLVPIPSALTHDGANHASRLLPMVFPIIFLSAYGFNQLINLGNSQKRKIVLFAFSIFMILNITKFIHRYFEIWPNISWRFWQSGFKETITYVKAHDGEYSRIYLNNTYEPMLSRFLFWYDYDMALFQKQFQDDKHIEDLVPGFNGFTLGEKYYFGEFESPIEQLLNKDHLIVASAERDITNPEIFNKPEIELLETFYSPTGIPIFYVFTGKVLE